MAPGQRAPAGNPTPSETSSRAADESGLSKITDASSAGLLSEQPVPGKRRRSEEADHTSRKRVTTAEPITDDAICARCNDLPWSELRRKRESDRNGGLVTILEESNKTLLSSTCRVCQLLAQLKPATLDAKRCQLRIYSAKVVWGFSLSSSSDVRSRSFSDCSLLGVTHSGNVCYTNCEKAGFIAILDRGANKGALDFGPRFIDPDCIDFNLVRDWMSLCSQDAHQRTCAIKETTPIRGFCVLDCKKTVESGRLSLGFEIASPQYVALSYVWGSRQPPTEVDEAGSDSLAFSNIPVLIRDAILVTMKLGFNYLWVDRYVCKISSFCLLDCEILTMAQCIDQDDKSKHEQIRQMDKIYANSQLTIIAAACDNPYQGLPGVSVRRRTGQRSIDLRDGLLVQVLPHASCDLLNSTWASRGWTYQEAFLPRRRLIFTNEQVIYLCNKLHCAEAVYQPYHQLTSLGIRHFLSLIPSPTIFRDSANRPEHIARVIAAYSSRHLSYSSDAMNACLGLFNSMASYKDPIYHLWGLPIQSGSTRITRNFINLFWQQDAPSIRRQGFPSWSWVGWKGPISLKSGSVTLSVPHQIQHQVAPGKLASIHTFKATCQTTPFNYPDVSQHLYITARLFPTQIAEYSWTSTKLEMHTLVRAEWVDFRCPRRNGAHCKLEYSSDLTVLAPVYLDQIAPLDASYWAVIINQIHDYSPDVKYGMIIVKECGEDNFERVGVVPDESIRSKLPISFEDSAGDILDDVTLPRNHDPHWYTQGELRTIRLQ